ncbi:MAG: hypothetical protein KF767_17495 [Bdellovibrionaceae bacterium]|nr:hypothetical protein [Pseudobdellovibrionaceae bacterium]
MAGLRTLQNFARKLLFGASLALTAPAFAESGTVTTPVLFNCNMSFKIEGTSAYIGVGGTSASGSGRLSCYDYVTGAVEDIPLAVSIRGVGLGLGITGFNISGGQVGIGLSQRPESLLGSYARVSMNAALGVGAEAGAGLRLSFRKESFEISATLAGRSGLGAGVDISELRIERDESRSRSVTHGATAAASQPTVVADHAAKDEIPVENLVLKSQGAEVVLVNAEGRPVKKLKIFLLQK